MPAGQPAEWRSVSAATAMRLTGEDGFAGLGAAWCSCLLQEGMIFYDRQFCTYMVSLGFGGWSSLMWEVDVVSATVQR